MAVSYRIFPELGLVYVRYEGIARAEETIPVFARYAGDPLREPGQKQLVDMSRLTGMDRDFTKLMEMQARKAAAFMEAGAETLIVYFAPNAEAQALAGTIRRSWEPFPWVVPVIAETEADLVEVLGLPRDRLDMVRAATG